jgi:hypothetical protein
VPTGRRVQPYTLADLEAAERELEQAKRELAEGDSGRHSNPGRTRRWNAEHGELVSAAYSKVATIRESLIAQGLLGPDPERELAKERRLLRDELEHALDLRFPNAKSRQVVEYNGKRYRRRFAPARVSRSGNVIGWDRYWEPVK